MSDLTFQRGIPEAYEKFLVPLIFEPFARDLARRLGKPENAKVLELACGTGCLTRELRLCLPSSTALVATDPSEEMLAIAKKKVGPHARLSIQSAGAEHIPFPDGEFDAAVCQFGYMFFPDKVAGLKEIRRVLKPGGRVLFSVWDRLEKNDITRIINETLGAFFGKEAPEFFQVPFGSFDQDQLQNEMQEAGYGEIQIQVVKIDGCSHLSPESIAKGHLRGTPLANYLLQRHPEKMDELERVVARELGVLGDPIKHQMQAIVVTGLNPA